MSAEDTTTAKATAAGPGMVKLGILMLVAGALGGLASGAASAFLSPGHGSSGKDRPADAGPEATGGHGAEAGDGDGHAAATPEGGHGGTVQEAPMGAHSAPGVFVPGGDVLSLEPFVVNLADVGETRYLKATIKVSFTAAELLPRVKEDPGLLARARDACIIALSSRTSGELLTSSGKELLREDVRRSIESAVGLAPHSVRAVYFTEFVTQ